MKSWERLLKYVTVMTPSDEESGTVPSSACQFDLADQLAAELVKMGASDVVRDEKCYVYAKIPATHGLEKAPCLGFIAHMDTVSDFADHPVRPIVHPQYGGEDLPLGESGRILSKKMFPHISQLAGRTLITTDGTTILGADDKAGVAEIMTLAERLLSGSISHGPVAIGFTPDEEIGCGADHFDLERFGAAFAYTVDGGAEGDIEAENFNAGEAKIYFRGVNVHPGDAKDVMVNAAAAACAFAARLPEGETPRDTSGYEGFYHITEMSGSVAEAKLEMIIRDFDEKNLAARKEVLEKIASDLNEQYGAGTVRVEWTDQYRNMAEALKGAEHLIENAKTAAERAGTTPKICPVRGGTDGARLTWMGLPCPNLGVGGFACHGPYEHVTAEGMEMVVEILTELVRIYAGWSEEK